jgi:hypothetical protein
LGLGEGCRKLPASVERLLRLDATQNAGLLGLEHGRRNGFLIGRGWRFEGKLLFMTLALILALDLICEGSWGWWHGFVIRRNHNRIAGCQEGKICKIRKTKMS